MKKAVIEIGTNSVKLLLGECASGGAKILYDVNVITKLGEGLRGGGELSAAAIERTVQAAGKFAAFARFEGAEEIICVGTMALRTAKNAGDFIRRLYAQSALELRVLSGGEEAELSGRAVLNGIAGADSGELLIFDTGGGSTEFIYFKDGEAKRSFSVAIGAVTLTDEYFREAPADARTVCRVTADLTEGFRSDGVSAAPRVIGTGGNVTAIASVAARLAEYDPEKVHGSPLSAEELMRQIALYTKCTAEERRRIVGLSPQRADIILGGACIILAAMEAARVKEITVSDRGLRHELLRGALDC
ncbi:MAG: Ppx/GppA family phosphatase [Synergistaceae bacterium]|nr:Ppx/GppA family phosphatase [Synergistaceae bacterium]